MRRVVIVATLDVRGQWGGVWHFTASLIRALGQLRDGNEEYVIDSSPAAATRLASLLGRNQRLIVRPEPKIRTIARRAASIAGPTRVLADAVYGIVHRARPGRVAIPEDSDRYYERLSADVLHIPFQSFVRAGVPTVYNPHDLQHLHYPQFFDAETLALRDLVYPAGCREAAAVVVESAWVRDDVIRQFGVGPAKVHNVVWDAPTETTEPPTPAEIADVRSRLRFEPGFAFYPAQTWRHKNHVTLLRALATLRDRNGRRINLVCTGHRNHYWPTIRSELRDLHLDAQVQFLGYVPARTLRAIYRLAGFVVYPTLFEGGGFPVLEAFREGLPLVASRVMSLLEYGGDAAVFFDPNSVDDMADAIESVASNPGLRAELVRRGALRMKTFNWDRAARGYRAIYRACAGIALTDEDKALLIASRA